MIFRAYPTYYKYLNIHEPKRSYVHNENYVYFHTAEQIITFETRLDVRYLRQ